MNEKDRACVKSTWPPPGVGNEKGNDDKTAVFHVSQELLRRLIDEPTQETEEQSP